MSNYKGLTKEGKEVHGYHFVAEGRHFIIPDDAELLLAGNENLSLNGFVEVLPATVGQSTGLKDKNGKEIFKGDSFERNGHIGHVEQLDSGLWVIVFDDGKVIELRNDSEWNWWHGDNEIIGNIHSNPELMEASDEP